MSSDWTHFGPVAGIFWVWYFGVMVRFFGPLDGMQGADYTAHRVWPFVFIDARAVRASEREG